MAEAELIATIQQRISLALRKKKKSDKRKSFANGLSVRVGPSRGILVEPEWQKSAGSKLQLTGSCF